MWLESNNVIENEEKKEFPVKQESLKRFLVVEIGYLWPDMISKQLGNVMCVTIAINLALHKHN